MAWGTRFSGMGAMGDTLWHGGQAHGGYRFESGHALDGNGVMVLGSTRPGQRVPPLAGLISPPTEQS